MQDIIPVAFPLQRSQPHPRLGRPPRGFIQIALEIARHIQSRSHDSAHGMNSNFIQYEGSKQRGRSREGRTANGEMGAFPPFFSIFSHQSLSTLYSPAHHLMLTKLQIRNLDRATELYATGRWTNKGCLLASPLEIEALQLTATPGKRWPVLCAHQKYITSNLLLCG